MKRSLLMMLHTPALFPEYAFDPFKDVMKHSFQLQRGSVNRKSAREACTVGCEAEVSTWLASLPSTTTTASKKNIKVIIKNHTNMSKTNEKLNNRKSMLLHVVE